MSSPQLSPCITSSPNASGPTPDLEVLIRQMEECGAERREGEGKRRKAWDLEVAQAARRGTAGGTEGPSETGA